MNGELERFLVDASGVPMDPELDAFLAHFHELGGEALCAVLFYGSCFSGAGRSSSSVYDFFLVVDSYRGFYGASLHALLNKIVPPNLYHIEIPGPGGSVLRSKYNVVSLERIGEETGRGAHDHYFIARLSQKTGVLWARDERVRERLAAGFFGAARQAVSLAASYLEPARAYTPLEVFGRFLEISYASDTRIEAAAKLSSIAAADPAFYETLYEEAVRRAGGPDGPLQELPGGRFSLALSEKALLERRGETRRFLLRSKWKTLPRWAKHLLTFRDPVPYLLAKYERHTGVPVALTPLQRRFPLIFGWPALWRILRERLGKDRKTLEGR